MWPHQKVEIDKFVLQLATAEGQRCHQLLLNLFLLAGLHLCSAESGTLLVMQKPTRKAEIGNHHTGPG